MPHPAFRGYKTPRKSKTWADDWNNEAQVNQTLQSIDMLADYRTSLGIDESRDLTVMRILGRVQTVEDGTASTPAHGRVDVGICWVPTTYTASSGSIYGEGTRELEWIFRDTVLYAENSSVVTGRGCATVPPERNTLHVDSRMMRKQPTPRHRLMFFWVGDAAIESTTINIRSEFQVLLALP